MNEEKKTDNRPNNFLVSADAGRPDMIGYTYLGVPANDALYKPSGPLFEWIKGNIQLK